MPFLTFIPQKHNILHQMYSSTATYNHYVNQSQANSLRTSGLRRYIAEYLHSPTISLDELILDRRGSYTHERQSLRVSDVIYRVPTKGFKPG